MCGCKNQSQSHEKNHFSFTEVSLSLSHPVSTYRFSLNSTTARGFYKNNIKNECVHHDSIVVQGQNTDSAVFHCTQSKANVFPLYQVLFVTTETFSLFKFLVVNDRMKREQGKGED